MENSLDKAREQMENYLLKSLDAYEITWAGVIMNKDGNPVLKKMGNRPCYGEMRAYGPQSTRSEDYRPGDLTRPLPAKLERLMLGVALQKCDKDPDLHNRFIEQCFSRASSPWRRGIPDHLLLKNKEGFYQAVIFLNGDFDPTVAVSLFMNIRSMWISYGTTRLSLINQRFKTDDDFPLEWLILPSSYPNFQILANGYCLDSSMLSWKRFLNGESRDISNGKTWGEAEDYNRPDLAQIFHRDPDEKYFNPTAFLVELNKKKTNNQIPAYSYFPDEYFPEMYEEFRKYL